MKKTAGKAGAATYDWLEDHVGIAGAIALGLSALILLLLAGALILQASVDDWTTIGRVHHGELQLSKDTIIGIVLLVVVFG